MNQEIKNLKCQIGILRNYNITKTAEIRYLRTQLRNIQEKIAKILQPHYNQKRKSRRGDKVPTLSINNIERIKRK